jgi:hypothetical protein
MIAQRHGISRRCGSLLLRRAAAAAGSVIIVQALRVAHEATTAPPADGAELSPSSPGRNRLSPNAAPTRSPWFWHSGNASPIINERPQTQKIHSSPLRIGGKRPAGSGRTHTLCRQARDHALVALSTPLDIDAAKIRALAFVLRERLTTGETSARKAWLTPSSKRSSCSMGKSRSSAGNRTSRGR